MEIYEEMIKKLRDDIKWKEATISALKEDLEAEKQKCAKLEKEIEYIREYLNE